MLECKLKDDCFVNLRAGPTGCIYNKAAKTTTLSHVEQLVGFGVGNFKIVRGEVPEGGLEFKITDPETLVVVDNVPVPIVKALLHKKETNPDVKLCYHKVEWDTSKPEACTFEVTHRVAFVPAKDEAKKVVATNFACKESFDFWNNAATIVLWYCRWTLKGLQPVKPAVFLRGELTLEAGQACKFSS